MAVYPFRAAVLLAAATLTGIPTLPVKADDEASQSFAAARYSGLDEINAANVAQLDLAFAFRLPPGIGYAGTPQMAGHSLYVLTPFPHLLYAIELQGPGAGSARWSYSPPSDPAAEGFSLEESGNYGPTVTADTVYFNTLDGHTVALAADNGAVNWDVKSADLDNSETLVSAPALAGDAVLVGNAGDAFGVRGWIKALDRRTGQELWRKYTTGPDSEVGIDASFQPAPHANRGPDLGIASWPDTEWQHGGGTVPGLISYDAATGVIYHGTGHPAPGNPDQRPGDNKWTSGLFARDAKSGMARWFVQLNPHDPFGIGATAANVLAERDWHGAKRRLLIHPDGNGFVYVIDAATGEVLSAKPFTSVNAIEHVEGATGIPRRVAAKAVHSDSTTRDVCPAAPGAVSAGAAGFSPDSGLLFIPANALCMDLRPRAVSYIKATPYTGVTQRLRPEAAQPRGALIAWDLDRETVAWAAPEKYPIESGVLATAGGVVFYGTLDGWIRAADTKTGRVLWQFQTVSQVASQPATYRGPDGRQFLAVLAGRSGRMGVIGRDEVDTLDATAVNGIGGALRDLPQPPDPGGMLYVFRLR